MRAVPAATAAVVEIPANLRKFGTEGRFLWRKVEGNGRAITSW